MIGRRRTGLQDWPARAGCLEEAGKDGRSLKLLKHPLRKIEAEMKDGKVSCPGR